MNCNPYLPENNFYRTLLAKLLGLFLLLCLFLPACLQKSENFLWPDLNQQYTQVTQKWAKRSFIYSGVDVAFDATALPKSWEWRKAFVDKTALDYSYTEQQKEQMLADQKKAHSQGWDFVLAVAGELGPKNKLQIKDTLWNLFLQIGEKHIQPLEIRELEWSESKMQKFWFFWTPWQKFYVVHFPAQTSTNFILHLSGPVGKVSFGWQDFN